VTTTVTFGSNKPAIGGQALVRPISGDLIGQGGMKLEASARQLIERGAGAPVERQESASLARGCCSHLGPLHNNDIGPAASEEVGGAGPDHSAPTNHDPHDVSS
jgi:hypothetical protein